MCRHSDTVVCNPMLCEWLLYCSCVVTIIKLYVTKCYVSVIILFMCRHYDTVICNPMLCEWLLYCSCVVTMTQLYVA